MVDSKQIFERITGALQCTQILVAREEHPEEGHYYKKGILTDGIQRYHAPKKRLRNAFP